MSTKHVCDLCGKDATGPCAATVLVFPVGNLGLLYPNPASNAYGRPTLSEVMADLCAECSGNAVDGVRKRSGKPTWAPGRETER